MTAVQKRSETLSMIAGAVCKSAGIAEQQLTGENSGRHIANARKVFSVLCKMFGIGVKECGEFLKYADHSNIVTNQRLFFVLFREDQEIQVLFKKSLNELV